MAAKKTKQKNKKEDDTKLFAFLATFLSILGFIIALIAKRDNKYVMFYAKQSLVVFIGFVIAEILDFIPIVGTIARVFMVILWIFSWVYALSGKMKDTPIIGQCARKINL